VGSAPTRGRDFDQSVTFQGEIEFTESAPASSQLYRVQFNPNRSAMFHAPARLRFNDGDYVLTEADRGFDIGQVVEVIARPSPRDATGAKQIVRAATRNEVQQLAQKEEREARALQVCRAKAEEFGMPMSITRAEFQFDGKKLSFYYTAESYVDFRDLVRALFKVFGTRIWMVWYGGDQGAREG
jgi:cell fate regulator YaaT (PSP1 superfamily)